MIDKMYDFFRKHPDYKLTIKENNEGSGLKMNFYKGKIGKYEDIFCWTLPYWKINSKEDLNKELDIALKRAEDKLQLGIDFFQDRYNKQSDGSWE